MFFWGYHTERMKRFLFAMLCIAWLVGNGGCIPHVEGLNTITPRFSPFITPTRRVSSTPTRTPTRTITPSPVLRPAALVEGTGMELAYAVCFDLDSGQARTDLADPSCDVLFVPMPLGQDPVLTAAIVPVPPAAFAFEATLLLDPAPEQCQSNLPYRAQAVAREPRASEAICFQTNEGRFGWLALTKTWAQGVNFNYRTFAAQEIPRAARPEELAAAFLGETILDGTQVQTGSEFVKSWRLLNAGKKRWTTGFHLVYHSGDPMGQTRSVALPQDVLPGGAVDVSVHLRAPDQPGMAIGYWMLESDQGERFGLGVYYNEPFYVWIKAVPPGVLAPTQDTGLLGSAGVMAAALTASPLYYEGACPVQLAVNGKMWVRGKGEYTYQLLAVSTKPEYFNFGLPAPVVAENLKEEQVAVEFSYTLSINQSVKGWLQLAGLGNAGGVFSEKTEINIVCK